MSRSKVIARTDTRSGPTRRHVRAITPISVIDLYCRAEMYAGRVACCLLVNHVECAPRALLKLEKKTGQTNR